MTETLQDGTLRNALYSSSNGTLLSSRVPVAVPEASTTAIFGLLALGLGDVVSARKKSLRA